MAELVDELRTWVQTVSGDEWYWYVKILSGNDTLLNRSHQAGPYIPSAVFRELFPVLANSGESNPRSNLPVTIAPHGNTRDVTVIWYNNRASGGTRNEARITGWGGAGSPILDPEATGSAAVFAFHRRHDRNADACKIWLCNSVAEEDALEDLIGPVEPGRILFLRAYADGFLPSELPQDGGPCELTKNEIRPEWLERFPEASEVVALAVARLQSVNGLEPDKRLIERRKCEFGIFRSLEDAIVLPRISERFETVDQFVSLANSVTNRRKARSGISLELHACRIFDEEGLSYSWGEISEDRKRPDFLFPSAHDYRDESYPSERLLMLGVKTTCKDRWRQILNEAERVPRKYLLTLQQGVSENQYAEMEKAGVSLVVPRQIHDAFPTSVRPRLLSFGEFINRAKVQATG